MTLKVPGFMDGPSTDAQIARSILALLTNSAGGLAAAGGLAVTQKGTPDMHVLIGGGTLAEGGAIVPGTFTTSQGPYSCWNDASFELAIAASGATNPRVDTIILRVYDNAVDSSGKTEAAFESIKGAEEAGVTLENLKGIAAVPKSSLVLAYVLVPAKATSIVTADILKKAEVYRVARVLMQPSSFTVREVAYSKAEVEAGIEPSATRFALVSATAPTGGIRITSPIGTLILPGGSYGTFPVIAGTKWFAKNEVLPSIVETLF